MDKIIQVESFKMDLKEIEKILKSNGILDKKTKLKNISYYEADIKITEEKSFLHLKFYVKTKSLYNAYYNFKIELPLLLILTEYYEFTYNYLDDIHKSISLIETIKILKLKEKLEKRKIEIEKLQIKKYVFEIIENVIRNKIYIFYNKDIEKEKIRITEKNIFIENKHIWINISLFESVNKDIVLNILEKYKKELVISNV